MRIMHNEHGAYAFRETASGRLESLDLHARDSNPLASYQSACLADSATVRPTLRKLSKNKRILVGPVGVEPRKGLLLRQGRMPVRPRAYSSRWPQFHVTSADRS